MPSGPHTFAAALGSVSTVVVPRGTLTRAS